MMLWTIELQSQRIMKSNIKFISFREVIPSHNKVVNYWASSTLTYCHRIYCLFLSTTWASIMEESIIDLIIHDQLPFVVLHRNSSTSLNVVHMEVQKVKMPLRINNKLHKPMHWYRGILVIWPVERSGHFAGWCRKLHIKFKKHVRCITFFTLYLYALSHYTGRSCDQNDCRTYSYEWTVKKSVQHSISVNLI